MFNLRQVTRWLMLLVAMCIVMYQSTHLDHHLRGTDTGETLQMTYHLAKHQQFAFADSRNENSIYPTNFREPLPIVTWATALFLSDSDNTIQSSEQLNKSVVLKQLKYSNLIFLALLLGSLFWLTVNIPNAIIGYWGQLFFFISLILLINYLSFFNTTNAINNDLHSASLLALFSCLLTDYFKKPKQSKLLWIGFVFGLLCLTKASFFYTGAGLACAIAGYLFFRKLRIKPIIIVTLAALTVTVPWIIRNAIETEQAVISGRGPQTFVDRTYEEIWNDEHALGLLYAYGPDFLRPLMTKLTGYTVNDRFEGGRLQHSTRAHKVDLLARKAGDENMAINTHFKAGIWMTHVYNKHYEATQDPVRAKKLATQDYQSMALHEMFNKPMRHLKFTLIFAWRSIWVLNAIDGRTHYEMGQGKRESAFRESLAFLGLVSTLLLFFWALRKNHTMLLSLTATPLALYLFQSFFSHNLSRYSYQLVPMLIFAFLLMIVIMLARLRQWRFK